MATGVWVRFIVGSLGVLFVLVGLSLLCRSLRGNLHAPERYVWAVSPTVQSTIDVGTGMILLAAAILLSPKGAFTVLIAVILVTSALATWLRHRTRDRAPRTTDNLP